MYMLIRTYFIYHIQFTYLRSDLNQLLTILNIDFAFSYTTIIV